MNSSVSRARQFAKRRGWYLLALFLVCGVIAYPKPYNAASAYLKEHAGFGIGTITRPFVLGLDLQGGTHIEYEADVSNIAEADRREALAGVRDVIERRVNALGVSEPLIQTTNANGSYRVSVELAGVDVNEAMRRIGDTPVLEFKEQNASATSTLTAEQRAELERRNKEENARAQELLAQARSNPDQFAELAKEKNDLPALKAAAGDIGFVATSTQYQDLYQVFRDAAPGTFSGAVLERPDAYLIARAEESKVTGKEVHVRHLLILAPQQKTNPDGSLIPFTEDEQKQHDQALAKIQDLKKRATPANFKDLVAEFSEDASSSSTQGDLGYIAQGQFTDEAFEKAAFATPTGTISDVVSSQFGFHLIQKLDERDQKDVRVRIIAIKKTIESDIAPNDPWKSTELTGKQLASARVDFDPNTRLPLVSLEFNSEGAELFAKITRENINKQVGIFLDGELISAPTVHEEIAGGRAQISSIGSVDEAKLLARRLQAGALPVKITPVAQQTVGPTLGIDSLHKSLYAGLVGFALVALFMLVVYRIPGLMAVAALALYTVVSAAVFKLIPITLTLAGIAGFILSIGIAVDANVLVFERLKEELAGGKTLGLALEEAFKRAWPSIRDGHVTVLISTAVLYGFSSSIIRGFALTLAVGTLLSLFTAVVCTRTFLRIASQSFLAKYASLFLSSKKS